MHYGRGRQSLIVRRLLLYAVLVTVTVLIYDSSLLFAPVPTELPTSATPLYQAECLTSGQAHLECSDVRTFWRTLRDELGNLTPNAAPINLTKKADKYNYELKYNLEPTSPRLSLINLTSHDLQELKYSHRSMASSSRRLSKHLPFFRQTRGIVMTAGGKYFGMAIIALRMLRRVGSALPVVIFVDTEKDYDHFICDEVLPGLGAECVVLSKLLEEAPPATPLLSYQFKIFAILFSPFQEVLFLDADAFPAHNPDVLMELEPYKSTGLVLWPDFWVSTASPLFFEISDTPEPPVNARMTTEAGIILYDKGRHASDLLMAMYYNYFGPQWYYPLLSQGGPGQGDKDTFMAAAVALDAPFYDVKSPVDVMGRWINDTWHSVGMKQKDPYEDWKIETEGNDYDAEDDDELEVDEVRRQLRRRGSGSTGKKTRKQKAASSGDTPRRNPRPFFIHNNIFKLNVLKLSDTKSPLFERNQTGHIVRLWDHKEGLVREWGYDVEEALWQELIGVTCDTLHNIKCEEVRTLGKQIMEWD